MRRIDRQFGNEMESADEAEDVRKPPSTTTSLQAALARRRNQFLPVAVVVASPDSEDVAIKDVDVATSFSDSLDGLLELAVARCTSFRCSGGGGGGADDDDDDDASARYVARVTARRVELQRVMEARQRAREAEQRARAAAQRAKEEERARLERAAKEEKERLKKQMVAAMREAARARADEHLKSQSRYRGVYPVLWGGGKIAFRAKFNKNEANAHLGTFYDEEEAAKAYDAAVLKYHAEMFDDDEYAEGPEVNFPRPGSTDRQATRKPAWSGAQRAAHAAKRRRKQEEAALERERQRAQKKPPQCSNCGTMKSASNWRRGKDNQQLCNACGLYALRHDGQSRPLKKARR